MIYFICIAYYTHCILIYVYTVYLKRMISDELRIH